MKRTILFHNYFFGLGFFYYLVLPLLVVVNNWHDSISAFNILDDYNYKRFVILYTMTSLAIFVSFYLGSWLAYKGLPNKNPLRTEHILNTRQIKWGLFPFALFGLTTAYINRGSMFQGYDGGLGSDFASALCSCLLIFTFWLIYDMISNKKLSLYIGSLTFLFVIFIIGLGTRMYVLITFLTLLQYSIEYRVIKLKKLVFIIIGFILFLLSVGLIRNGDSIEYDGLLFIGLGETMYTWLSAESMFHYTKDLQLFYFPSGFFSAFINMIPTILLPNKADYVNPIPLPFDNPLGAVNLIVGMVSNFGLVGSCFFSAFLGSLLSYLRKKKSVFARTYYFCICAMIPFQLFRDGLDVVVKVALTNFFIIPLIMVWVTRHFLSKGRKYSI